MYYILLLSHISYFSNNYISWHLIAVYYCEKRYDDCNEIHQATISFNTVCIITKKLWHIYCQLWTHCILENERVFQTYRFMSFLRLVVHDYLRGVSAAKHGRTRKAIIHMFWWASESDPNYWTQSLQFFLAIDCHIYLAYERNSKRLFHNGILWLCCDGGIDMAYNILTSFSSLLKK